MQLNAIREQLEQVVRATPANSSPINLQDFITSIQRFEALTAQLDGDVAAIPAEELARLRKEKIDLCDRIRGDVYRIDRLQTLITWLRFGFPVGELRALTDDLVGESSYSFRVQHAINKLAREKSAICAALGSALDQRLITANTTVLVDEATTNCLWELCVELTKTQPRNSTSRANPSLYECPISLDPVSPNDANTVVLTSGFIYAKNSIMGWIEESQKFRDPVAALDLPTFDTLRLIRMEPALAEFRPRPPQLIRIPSTAAAAAPANSGVTFSGALHPQVLAVVVALAEARERVAVAERVELELQGAGLEANIQSSSPRSNLYQKAKRWLNDFRYNHPAISTGILIAFIIACMVAAGVIMNYSSLNAAFWASDFAYNYAGAAALWTLYGFVNLSGLLYGACWMISEQATRLLDRFFDPQPQAPRMDVSSQLNLYQRFRNWRSEFIRDYPILSLMLAISGYLATICILGTGLAVSQIVPDFVYYDEDLMQLLMYGVVFTAAALSAGIYQLAVQIDNVFNYYFNSPRTNYRERREHDNEALLARANQPRPDSTVRMLQAPGNAPNTAPNPAPVAPVAAASETATTTTSSTALAHVVLHIVPREAVEGSDSDNDADDAALQPQPERSLRMSRGGE